MAETPEEKEKRAAIEYLDERIRSAMEFEAIAKTRFADHQNGKLPDAPTSVKSYYAFQAVAFDNFEAIFEWLKSIVLNLYEIAKETDKTSVLSQQLSALQGELDKHKPMLEALREHTEQARKYLRDNR